MVPDEEVNVGVMVERLLEKEITLPGRYVDVLTEWMECGEMFRLWGRAVEEVEGQEKMETVYVCSDVDTVEQLWPGLGREMGLMVKLLEEYG